MSSNSRATWSELGALTTAGTVAATILCCLPFATGIVGASVAAFGARFAPVRPYLMSASLVMLGYAFYQAYRPDAACAGDACDLPASRRRRRIVLWIVATGIMALLTSSWWANWAIYWTL
jgi:hypothetical protein